MKLTPKTASVHLFQMFPFHDLDISSVLLASLLDPYLFLLCFWFPSVGHFHLPFGHFSISPSLQMPLLALYCYSRCLLSNWMIPILYFGCTNNCAPPTPLWTLFMKMLPLSFPFGQIFLDNSLILQTTSVYLFQIIPPLYIWTPLFPYFASFCLSILEDPIFLFRDFCLSIWMLLLLLLFVWI